MLRRVRLYLELVRFSHTVFALPFALMSALIAWRAEPFRSADLLGVVLCMVTARTFGMAFNRLADRRFDALNPRTAGRHLPAGTLSVVGVAVFTAVSAVAFLAATLLFVVREPPNWWPLILSVPVLAVVAVYSLTKRFTSLAHFWLGLSLALAPVATWIALRGFVQPWPALALGVAVAVWIAGADILYACQDADFDRQAGLHSVPARLGVSGALWVARASHAVAVLFLVLTGLVAEPPLGWVYFGGVAAAAALLVYEHALVRADDLSRVNQAFFLVNAVLSVGLLTVVAIDVAVASGGR